MKKKKYICKITDRVYQIKGGKNSSNSYLLLGKRLKVLIDSGSKNNFPNLKKALDKLKVKVNDIHLIINTHEHYDHISANSFFKKSIIAAHRFAATKILESEHNVTLCKYYGIDCSRVIDIWLENRTNIDLGGISLKVLHTPGHTSGCICLYEYSNKLLFSGDTVFAKGTLSHIAPSGSAGDYINSIKRLSSYRVKILLPGHGWISKQPENDFKNAIKNAKNLIKEENLMIKKK